MMKTIIMIIPQSMILDHADSPTLHMLEDLVVKVRTREFFFFLHHTLITQRTSSSMKIFQARDHTELSMREFTVDSFKSHPSFRP